LEAQRGEHAGADHISDHNGGGGLAAECFFLSVVRHG
ncbi:MAG: hypothetical protein RL336_1455, partial [Pseudomonadota bacterium]